LAQVPSGQDNEIGDRNTKIPCQQRNFILAIGVVWIVLVPCEILDVSASAGYFILDTGDRLAYS
jgi:hypothetical protein